MAAYADVYWDANGTFAINTTARVFHRFSSVLAPLFSDPAMTVAIANPTSTDGIGVLQFHAAPGDYWIHIRGLTFDVVIGDDFSWHGVYPHVQLIAADPWLVTHNLNSTPAVSVVDGSGNELLGQVTHTSLNTLTIDFGVLQTGTARSEERRVGKECRL